MRLIETQYRLEVGGSCARCGIDYSGSIYDGIDGFRTLCAYDEAVVEPFNLCADCLDELDNR